MILSYGFRFKGLSENRVLHKCDREAWVCRLLFSDVLQTWRSDFLSGPASLLHFPFLSVLLKMTYETGACWNEKFSWIKSMIFISLFLVLQEDNHLWDKILFCTTQRRVSEKEVLSCSCIQGYPNSEKRTRTTVIPPTFTNQ